MNAEKYLTSEQIWIELTSEIRDLDGKSIVIIDSEEGEIRANLRLAFESNPNSADTRKCSVVVWRSQADETAWGNAQASPTPTMRTDSLQRFLTRDALDLIRPNDRDPTQGDLMLVLPVPLE